MSIAIEAAPPATAELDALLFAGAAVQARALADGRVSALALLEHVLAQLERHEAQINAVVVRDDDAARAAARAADAALAAGERRPLLGVPFTVKENVDVAGWVTSLGDPAQAGNRAPADAPLVAALRAAGAVLVGKTNVPLNLTDLQSYNAIYGITRNPWDLARSPGGSSGGSAVAVAAGYVAVEVGTDIGGSIRVPAHFTGIYGHKPSQGLVALRGVGLPTGRLAERDLACAGPLARTADDLALVLPLLLNQDPLQRKAWQATLPAPRHTRLADFRVLLIDQWPGLPPSLNEQQVAERLTTALRAQGVAVQRVADLPAGLLPDLAEAHRLYRSLLAASSPPPETAQTAQRRARWRDAPEDGTDDTAWQRGAFLSHAEWLARNETRLRLRQAWERVFEHVDVVLSPVLATTAFKHDHSEPRDTRLIPVRYADGVRPRRFIDLFHWAGLPVLPGLPVTSFPLGLDDTGLPLGAQAIGPYLEDLTPIAFAQALAPVTGGFVPPPGFGVAA